MSIFWVIFFILFPALILYLCRTFPFLNKIGAVVLCYGVGILIGNSSLLPQNIYPVQDTIMSIVIPLAIPLIFFSIDIKKWSRLAGKSLFSFTLEVLSVVFIVSAGFFLFRSWIGKETWKLSGMLIGVYTGGTPNLAAIGTALGIDPAVYIAAHASDVFIGAAWLLIVITVLQKIMLWFLPPFQKLGENQDQNQTDFDSYAGIFSYEVVRPLAGALALALVIFALGAGMTLVVPKELAMVGAILTVSTLGIALSLIPAVRNIPMTFQLGQYLILIFCLVVSSMADLQKLFQTAPAVFGLVAFVYFFSVALHAGLAALFRIDADTVIITSAAGLYSPPFIPLVASALKNKEIIVSGVITGIIGWVIGTYLGIGVAYLLRLF